MKTPSRHAKLGKNARRQGRRTESNDGLKPHDVRLVLGVDDGDVEDLGGRVSVDHDQVRDVLDDVVPPPSLRHHVMPNWKRENRSVQTSENVSVFHVGR